MELWIIVLLCGTIIGADSLHISKLVFPEEPRAGDSVTLQCDYDLEGGPLYSVKWYRNRMEFFRYLENDRTLTFPIDGMYIDLTKSNDKQVTLSNVTANLSGKYSCEVSLDAPIFDSVVMSQHLNISRVGSLNNITILLPQDVKVGDATVLLQCNYELDGERLYAMKWYKDDNEFYRYMPRGVPHNLFLSMPGIEVNLTASDDNYVTLMNVTQDTAGNYTCKVSTEAPHYHTLIATEELILLNNKKGNIFSRAVNWIRKKWHQITH